ncbi:GTP binding protein [Colletotrichum truncatum]|uniref:GTP binding protein n=1 Tax=Colletotrichum truncatum TaxID=5467 RepID=A0ACC3YJ08_COLTU|nr:GTP binding protein [Colletotrichum truncatum]KAF6797136.1 GTP binding protein [Colletotrichum truncatum]
MASSEEPVHPLRISKGSTGSPPPKASNPIPRALSELSPSDHRRNSPSFNQQSKKMTLNTDSSPFQSSPMETTTSPRLFWQKRNLDSISTESNSLYGGSLGSPSQIRRTSIERLQKASRVKNSNILALEQKQEYDPTKIPQIERPLAKHQGNAYGGAGTPPTAIINGLRSSDSLSRGFGHQRNNSSKSSIPIYSPATSPSKASTASMQANPSSPPKSPGKEPTSPMKSSLSRSNFKNSFDPETGTWSADTSFDDRELPSGKSLHRHAKSVTFDAAPPQINEYEMATPDISSIGSNSREGSFESMDDEDDDDEHYHLGDHDIGEDSFDASLEDTDKTPVVGPDDWRQSAERMDDPFESSPMPESQPGPLGRPEHVRSDSSTSDHRPLPPLPGMGGSLTRRDSRSSPGLSATAERMLGAHRSLPSPPPAASSKSEIQSIGNGKMTLEERLKLMMLSDDHKSASEQQRERRMRRGAQRDRFQSPSSETETAESSMLEADEEDDAVGDISALEDYELPERISRESILRRANTEGNTQQGDYFSSPVPSSSPERGIPERRLPLPLDPDVPIPSTEDSILDDDEISDLEDEEEEEGSVIIHRDEDTDAETDSITDFYARSDLDENESDSASHYSDGPARVPEVTQVDEHILTPRAASPQQAAFQSFDMGSEIRPLELKSDKTGSSSPTETPIGSPTEIPAKEPTPEPAQAAEPQVEATPEPEPKEKFTDSPADLKSTLPEMKDGGKDNEFSKGLQSFMLPPPPEPTPQDLEDLQPPPKMTDLQSQLRPTTPIQQTSTTLYDGSGWGEPEDEYDDEPGTPESVIHRPIEDSEEEEEEESEMFEEPIPAIPEEPLESPAIPERQATIKASGSKLKTRPSNTPSDIIAMREARRQVSREVPDIPPIPERHRNRLSRDLSGAPDIGDEELMQRHPSLKKRSLTLDLDFGLSLDQDFDRVIEQQKVVFSQQVCEASHIASGSADGQASRPTTLSRKIITAETESQNANIESRTQRGYLMRQNTKLVTASDKESDDMWKTRSAGNSPIKTDRPQSWIVEPWNGRPRQKSIRRRANTSGPVPPLPGQESNAHTLNPLAEEDLNPELATEESGERGRLFVKVLGVKDLDLPIPRNDRTWFSLTLDNGVHCVTTAWLELARNAPIGQEFELVVPNDLEFQLTLNVKLEKPIPKKVVVQSPTKAPKPKTSTFSRVFASPKKRKEMELRAREEEERLAAQQREAQARQMKVAPTAWDLLSPLAAEDGSFARSYVCLKEHESRCYGRPYVVDVACFNEWATEEAAFASSVKSKRGNTAVVRRAPYKIGKLELQLLFVPRPKGATDEDMPKSMNSCIREIKAAEERLAKNWEGHLSQQGGDCPYWRRRYFKLVGTKLTAYHEATRQPRATINLTNAKRLIDDRRALTERETTGKNGRRRRSAFAEEEEGYMFVEEGFRIRFNNGELIDFYADTAEDKEGWMQALTDVVGRGDGGADDDGSGSRHKGKWCELVLKREEALRRRAEGRRVHSRTKSTFN